MCPCAFLRGAAGGASAFLYLELDDAMSPLLFVRVRCSGLPRTVISISLAPVPRAAVPVPDPGFSRRRCGWQSCRVCTCAPFSRPPLSHLRSCHKQSRHTYTCHDVHLTTLTRATSMVVTCVLDARIILASYALRHRMGRQRAQLPPGSGARQPHSSCLASCAAHDMSTKMIDRRWRWRMLRRCPSAGCAYRMRGCTCRRRR